MIDRLIHSNICVLEIVGGNSVEITTRHGWSSLKHVSHECEMAQVPIDRVKDGTTTSWNNCNSFWETSCFSIFSQLSIQRSFLEASFFRAQGCIAQSGGGFVFARLRNPSYVSGIASPLWQAVSQLVTWMLKVYKKKCHPSKSQRVQKVSEILSERDSQIKW